jgi:hypothetical protein
VSAISLVATGGGRYRVMRAGAEVSAHTQYHSAIAAGIAAKAASPSDLVEVVSDFRVRVEISGTEPPVSPPPVSSPPPVISPPAIPPPPVVPPVGAGLLATEASTMQPGEWRNIAHLTNWPGKDQERSFNSLQVVQGTASDGSGGADGFGWTQRLVLKDGRLFILLMRDAAPVSLLGMDADGTFWRKDTWRKVDGAWSRVEEMTGWAGSGWSESSGGRRPFNRLTQDATHLYFSRTHGLSKEQHGRTYRMAFDNTGVFEDSGHDGFNQSNIDTVGNHAILWVEQWGRFYAYTPSGHVYTRTPEQTGWWDEIGRTPVIDGTRASGYAGEIAFNPIKNELVVIGGQSFGSPPGVGNKWAVLRSPTGPIEPLPDLPVVGGEQLTYTSAQGKIFTDPRNGDYLLQVGRERIYRTADAANWTVYADIYKEADRPFGSYDSYAPFALIPGTDVVVFLSHLRGVVLHRLKG